jgi:DNA replicative helicase MCM subunit Mcm2 (Cdc46/Mcm family)
MIWADRVFLNMKINKYNLKDNIINQGDIMDDKEKVIEAFRNSEDPLNAKKVSELSGVEKKEVDKIMKELKKDETIVSPKRCYWTLAEK